MKGAEVTNFKQKTVQTLVPMMLFQRDESEARRQLGSMNSELEGTAVGLAQESNLKWERSSLWHKNIKDIE